MTDKPLAHESLPSDLIRRHVPAARVWAKLSVTVFLAVFIPALAIAQSLAPPDDPARELGLLLRKLDQTARVLYVTAHPDDEDTGLLARLTHGEGVETALMTLTRGEGGQNEIGTELSHALGELRSRELQAAGRYLGVRQYFSRAYEFGYSFSVEETYEKWHKSSILRDVVRVIREFRPDVILTMPPRGTGGGQHHQASARIAAEAMEVAATPEWPELGPPHKASRLFRQVWGPESVENLCEIPLGEYDTILGCTYAALGVESRAQHKCQGMARLTDPLSRRSSRWEWLQNVDGPIGPAGHILEGLRDPLIEGDNEPTEFGQELSRRVALIREQYRPEEPNHLVPALLDLWEMLSEASVPESPQLSTLKSKVARSLYLASALQVVARADRRFVAPDQSFRVNVQARNAGPFPLEAELRFTGPGMSQISRVSPNESSVRLDPGEFREESFDLSVDPQAAVTISRPTPLCGDLIGDASAREFSIPHWSAFQLQVVMKLEGRVVPVPPRPIDYQEVDARFPSVFYSDPHIIPDPSVRFRQEVLPFPILTEGDSELEIEVLVSSLKPGPLEVGLETAPGWEVTPERREIMIQAAGEEYPVSFSLRPVPAQAGDGAWEVTPLQPMTVEARAFHSDEADTSSQGYIKIEYPHIRPGALLQQARVQVVPFACETEDDVRVGYVQGAGDRVLEALERIGVAAEVLGPDELLDEPLDDLDVIITGIRAYKVREDLKSAQPRLLEWVRKGGTLLVQYNKFEFNGGNEESSPFAPFPETLVGRRRVTVEESPVVVRDPLHPAFVQPNRITGSDWQGWVQERGLYFLDFADSRYQDLLELEDPWPYNAGPQGGSLVYAPLGDGEWVYIGIGLFRQLPAAVPGAYRLLANLIALGKD
jgi:LmbE family N-acetylglucosaminyl deacetylase